MTSIVALACAVPGAQAAPTWLPAGYFDGGEFPSVAMNNDGVAAIGFDASAGGGNIVAHAALHVPGSDGFGTPFDVSPATGTNNLTGTAVNARGDVVVSWTDTAHVWIAIRPAGGAFGAPISLGPNLASGLEGVQVGLSDSGDVAAAWLSYDTSNYVVHWIVKPAGSAPGTLGSAVMTNASTGGPRLAMDAAGDTVVTWAQHNGTHWYVREVSRPAGGSFGSPVSLSDPSQDAFYPYPAVSDNGGAAIAWSRSNGTDNIIQLSRRTSATADFGVPTDVSRTGGSAYYPTVALNDSGQMLVAWSREGDAQARSGSLTGSFSPTITFEAAASPPSAAISDSGAGIVAWGALGKARASLRSPGGAFDTPFDLTPDGVTVPNYANYPTAKVAFDGSDDVLATWLGSGNVGYRVYDAAGPRLDGLSVPGTATAGTAAAFSVAPLDAFSAIASTHWDFGDGSGADGASASHTYNSAGTYTVKVTSTDAVGNATSATNTITIAAAPPTPTTTTTTPPPPPPPVCKVPKLKGLTLAKAKKKLTAAHCKLGTVLPKKLQKSKSAVITKQSRKAGTTTSANAKVNVTLAKKPKPKRR